MLQSRRKARGSMWSLVSAGRALHSLPESPVWVSSFFKNKKQNVSRKFQFNLSPSESNFPPLLGSGSVAVNSYEPCGDAGRVGILEAFLLTS